MRVRLLISALLAFFIIPAMAFGQASSSNAAPAGSGEQATSTNAQAGDAGKSETNTAPKGGKADPKAKGKADPKAKAEPKKADPKADSKAKPEAKKDAKTAPKGPFIPAGAVIMPIHEALLGDPLLSKLIVDGVTKKYPEKGLEALKVVLQAVSTDTNLLLYYYPIRSELGNMTKNMAVINGAAAFSLWAMRSNTMMLKCIVRTRAASAAIKEISTNTNDGELSEAELAILKDKSTVLSDAEKKDLEESNLFLTISDIAASQIAVQSVAMTANVALIVAKFAQYGPLRGAMELAGNNLTFVPLVPGMVASIGGQIDQIGKRGKKAAKDVKARQEVMKVLLEQKAGK